MTKSALFSGTRYLKIQEKTRDFLNQHEDFLSERTAKSPRAVGDAVQGLLSENFRNILGPLCAKYWADFARRAMADLAFEDQEGLYYCVDVKTHRLSTKFNMPALTSVERLADLYESDSSFFVILMITYDVVGSRVNVERVRFVPIEFLDWDCLRIGALGKGQIQIANSNIININTHNSRKKWMLTLCDNLFEFYPREIGKIEERIEYFRKVKQRWEQRPE